MHKSATKCNETIDKWCKNKHGASKIIDTFETYQRTPRRRSTSPARQGQSGSSSPGASLTGVTSGDEGDERRRNRQIPTVRRGSARRRSECATRRRRGPPELTGIERRSRRRLIVARERERLGLGFEESERGGAADWAGLVRPNPLGLTWPVGPGCQPNLFFFWNN
jgi:hypothetical protein